MLDSFQEDRKWKRDHQDEQQVLQYHGLLDLQRRSIQRFLLPLPLHFRCIGIGDNARVKWCTNKRCLCDKRRVILVYQQTCQKFLYSVNTRTRTFWMIFTRTMVSDINIVVYFVVRMSMTAYRRDCTCDLGKKGIEFSMQIGLNYYRVTLVYSFADSPKFFLRPPARVLGVYGSIQLIVWMKFLMRGLIPSLTALFSSTNCIYTGS